MSRVHLIFKFLFLFLLFLVSIAHQFYLTNGDVGTAAPYSPPYTPTTCYGSDPSQFPPSNLFGAAGDGIWDDGAACGRQYLIRCINAPEPYACADDENNTIEVIIVDYAPSAAPSASTTMVLSTTAIGTIASSSSAEWINIEFQPV